MLFLGFWSLWYVIIFMALLMTLISKGGSITFWQSIVGVGVTSVIPAGASYFAYLFLKPEVQTLLN